VHAEGEDAASVSIVDRLERSIVPGAQPRYQTLITVIDDGPAVEPIAEPDNCHIRPHTRSLRYITPKVQRATPNQ
jgi:hypothetical protein